ncbi:hypothetical protein ACHAWU_002136 [Discostella pseudostelligera]|uniref:Uncharacterized protein n=1 Tax=Discostella pseudostelligera TaxID=259834 RepID=A0ABD3MD51_9STRA
MCRLIFWLHSQLKILPIVRSSANASATNHLHSCPFRRRPTQQSWDGHPILLRTNGLVRF